MIRAYPEPRVNAQPVAGFESQLYAIDRVLRAAERFRPRVVEQMEMPLL
ncbi:hypothetical protein ACI2IY_23435 [Lysobacter enzymogenes]